MQSFAAIVLALWLVLPLHGQQGAKDGQWRHYAGDLGSTKYAPLDLVNRANVAKLKIAWRWSSPDNDIRRNNPFRLFDLMPFIHEPTPLFVNGVLYTSTSMSQSTAVRDRLLPPDRAGTRRRRPQVHSRRVPR